jgi:hypothetical protein
MAITTLLATGASVLASAAPVPADAHGIAAATRPSA